MESEVKYIGGIATELKEEGNFGKKKVNYINAAVTGMKREGDTFIVELHDFPGKFFCRKELGIKTSSGYKFGIIDGKEKGTYEIVSVEQQIIRDPAFAPKAPGGQKVQMSMADYKDLLNAKHLRIRTESLNSAIKICENTLTEKTPEKFMRKVLTVAKDLEPYFE